MKNLLLTIAAGLLLANTADAQFSVGASGMTIVSGTQVFIDSLVLTPSANYTVASNTLQTSYTSSIINGANSIKRVYVFSSPLTGYNGGIGIDYISTELNGNTATSLAIAYTADNTNWSINHTGGVLPNATAPYVYTSASGLSNATFTRVTSLSSRVYWSKASGDLTQTATWGANNDGTGTAPLSFVWPADVFCLSNRTGTVSLSNDLLVDGTFIVNPNIDFEIGAHTLTLNNTVTSIGTIGGSSASGLTIGGNAGTINFTSTGDTLGKLTLTNGASMTLGTALNMAAGGTPGIVKVSTGATLNTNDNLVLRSDSLGTAFVAPIEGVISGALTAQQYIHGGRRAVRHISHPFTTAQGLNILEDNIDITGNGGSANGFTSTLTNNPSAFWYNPLASDGNVTNDAGFIPYTSTDGTGANAWNQYQAIRILVRGVKGVGIFGETYTPQPVTLDMKGTINQGDVTMPMHVGANSSYNILGNPYPSPVDVGTIIYNAKQAGQVKGTAFWVWNTNEQAKGAYVPVLISNTPYTIQANSSFMVSAMTEGATLNFHESNKATSGTTPLFRTTNANDYVTLHIFDTTGNSWDRMYLQFNGDATDTIDEYDAVKPHNSEFDFYSISTNHKELAIDARPYATQAQIIPLGITSYVQQPFVMKVDDFNVPTGAILYLHDKYLAQYQQLQQGAQYAFEVNADTLSQGNNRFELALEYTAPTAVATVQNNAATLNVTLTPNPATDVVNINYTSPTKETTTLRVINTSGIEVVKMDLGVQQDGSVKIPVRNFAAGMYIVELTSGNKTISQRLVKE